MNLSTIHASLAGAAAQLQPAAYDYERIGPVKIDWLGLILLVLIFIAIATVIRGVIKQRAARRTHDPEK